MMMNAVDMAKTQIKVKLDDSVSDEKSADRYNDIEYTQCPGVTRVISLSKRGSSTSILEFVKAGSCKSPGPRNCVYPE
jgi:hypothetical protein